MSSYTPPRKSLRGRHSSVYDSRPSTPSALGRSQSTRFDMDSNNHTIPRRSTGLISTPLRTQTASILDVSNSTSSSPLYRRNAGFGSPGFAVRHSTSTQISSDPKPSVRSTETISNQPRKPRASRAIVRKKPWFEKFKTAPVDLFYRLQSEVIDLEDLIQDPSLGIPLGVTLHFLSLISHLISPNSAIGAGLIGKKPPSRPAFGNPKPVLFSSSSSPSSPLSADGSKVAMSHQLRKLAERQMEFWFRWISIGLSFGLVALSCYNAYILFTRQRGYRLWLRNEKDSISSQNARLVPVPMDDTLSEPDNDDLNSSSLSSRWIRLSISLLGSIPILGWFFPAESESSSSPSPFSSFGSQTQIQMHQLDVWNPSPLLVHLFCIYSPAHSFWWFLVPTFIPSLIGWVIGLIVLFLFSIQSLIFSKFYSNLIKDRSLLAAEVMHEYDEKFVLPRAMPVVRDATTMTDPFLSFSSYDHPIDEEDSSGLLFPHML